jgi:hypothetical protein
LKQLLVVFTPYPGFKAVREDHALKRVIRSEQPFFIRVGRRFGHRTKNRRQKKRVDAPYFSGAYFFARRLCFICVE